MKRNDLNDAVDIAAVAHNFFEHNGEDPDELARQIQGSIMSFADPPGNRAVTPFAAVLFNLHKELRDHKIDDIWQAVAHRISEPYVP